MKRLIIILMMLLIHATYVGAEDKEPVDLAKVKILYDHIFFKEKMTKENEMADFLDCIEGERPMLNYGGVGVGGKITNPLNGYENEKINISPFSWIIIPNIDESQPSGMIQFTYYF